MIVRSEGCCGAVIVSRPPPFVVIAESNAAHAARYEDAVRSLGLVGRTVGNGADALSLILRTPSPVLVVANSLLPRVDGESVVRYMRAGQIDVPAILLGDSPQLVARLRGLRIPDTEVLSIDVDLPDLRAAVSRMVAPAIASTSPTDAGDVRANGADTSARSRRRKGGARPGMGPCRTRRKPPRCRVIQRGSIQTHQRSIRSSGWRPGARRSRAGDCHDRSLPAISPFAGTQTAFS